MMSCAIRRRTLTSLLLTKDDEEANYLHSYKSRNKKRSMTEYDNCRMKKSRTVNDMAALIMGCHDDVRKVANCNSEESFKVLVEDCIDNYNRFRQAPPLDIGLEQHFLFLTVTAPLSSTHFISEIKPQKRNFEEDEILEDDDEAPSI